MNGEIFEEASRIAKRNHNLAYSDPSLKYIINLAGEEVVSFYLRLSSIDTSRKQKYLDSEEVQDTLKALSDPTRRKILELLKKKAMTAGEIAGNFNVSGRTISHHLSILKDADLVSDLKQGTFIYYNINTSVMEDVLYWLSSFMQGGEENSDEKVK